MKRLICILSALSALAACDKVVHDEPEVGNGFLSVALVWEDKFNSTDEIESISLWIFDRTGTLSADNRYPSASDLALQKYEIQAGNVAVVVGVNVNGPIEPQYTSTPEALKYELARQCALHEMAFYGDKTVEVVDGESCAVYVPLHDKPHEDTFITPDPDVNDWEHDGDHTNEDIYKPNN